MFLHAPAAANLSAVTEMAISGEMEASTAAGSAALTATTPMVPTADDSLTYVLEELMSATNVNNLI
jgi:hypothetical protein